MNMGIYEGAIGYFEQQLATLEQLSSHTSLTDKVHFLIFFFNFMYYSLIIIYTGKSIWKSW